MDPKELLMWRRLQIAGVALLLFAVAALYGLSKVPLPAEPIWP